MSNRQVTYTLLLNSRVRQELVETESAAKNLDNTMSSLHTNILGIGAALGVAAAWDKGKEWLEGAAQYQDATNRIRFASENLTDGADNMRFIREEVDKFKIPLQSTTDAYGKFLAMVQGSGMAADQVRHLHDNLLLIGKIKHLDAGQLEAGVMNLGKMLEAGSMDARHLRPLEMQLSGIGKFIADEMGVSIHELAKLRNKGKLTDIDPTVLEHAIEKQANSLEKYLPEALESLQSSINDTDNAWLNFKNDIGGSSEFREILGDVNQLTHWILENESTMKSWGGTIINLGLAWGIYKVASQGALAIETARLYLTQSSYALSTTASIAANLQLNSQIALEQKLFLAQEAKYSEMFKYMSMSGTLHTDELIFLEREGLAWDAIDIAIRDAAISAAAFNEQVLAGSNIVNMSAATRGISSSVGGMGAGLAGAISTGLMMVGIAWIAPDVAYNVFGVKTGTKMFEDKISGFDTITGWFNGKIGNVKSQIAVEDQLKEFVLARAGVENLDPKGSTLYNVLKEVQQLNINSNDKFGLGGIDIMSKFVTKDQFGRDSGTTNEDLRPIFERLGFAVPFLKGGDKLIGDVPPYKKDPKLSSAVIPKSNHIRGNSVTNVTVNIHELNGMKQCTFTVSNTKSYDDLKNRIGTEVTKIASDAINDSLIVVGKH